MRAKINEETVQSMKQSLMVGLTLKEACELEDISTSTWRRYEAKHPDIRRKRKRWQKALEIRAKVIIANKVYDNQADITLNTFLIDSLTVRLRTLKTL